MANTRVALRYAKSLLGLAEERGDLEKVYKDMLLIKETCEVSRDFRLLLKSPIVDSSTKLKISKKLFEAKVDVLTMEFMKLVFVKGRESGFFEITKAFEKLYNEFKGIQPATIKTAFPLSKSLVQEFEKIVQQATGKKPLLTQEVDPEMIGGFLLRIDDKQIDASVGAKLRKLKTELGA